MDGEFIDNLAAVGAHQKEFQGARDIWHIDHERKFSSLYQRNRLLYASLQLVLTCILFDF